MDDTLPDIFEQLPNEILGEIFNRVPTSERLTLALISHRWYTVFQLHQ